MRVSGASVEDLLQCLSTLETILERANTTLDRAPPHIPEDELQSINSIGEGFPCLQYLRDHNTN